MTDPKEENLEERSTDQVPQPDARDGIAPPAWPAIMQFFEYEHLPPHLQVVSSAFSTLAWELVANLPDNPQRERALEKLIEAKDCAVRARLFKIAIDLGLAEQQPQGARLAEHDLLEGFVELDALLLQAEGTDEGRPCVMFVVVLDDGSRVLTKTTFRLLQTAMAGLHGALQRRFNEAMPASPCATAQPMRAIYPCGCSHHKVEFGMCSVYAPDGSVRQPKTGNA